MDTEIDKDEMDWDKNNEKTEDHEFFAPTEVVEHNHKRKELEMGYTTTKQKLRVCLFRTFQRKELS